MNMFETIYGKKYRVSKVNPALVFCFLCGLLAVATAVSGQDIGALQQYTAIQGVTRGGTGTATQFTQGSIVFAGANGVYSQDNPAVTWDATNHCLTIGSGNSGCGATSGAALFFRNTDGVVAKFQNSFTNSSLQFGVNNVTGGIVLQNRNIANSANLPLELQTAGGSVIILPLASVSGTRFICISTTGVLSSSAAACSGT